MIVPRYSKRARRHAAESKQRTKKMLGAAASRSGPVRISYLPGSEPPGWRTKFPFKATINGREVIVWPDWIEYPEEDPFG
jgi:hypothetical protein